MLAIYEGTSGDLVRHHNDDRRFHPTSTDIEIITSLHQEDPEWVFVGGDGKILKYKAKIAVSAERDLTYLMLNHNWCNKHFQETCWMLIKGWPKIKLENREN